MKVSTTGRAFAYTPKLVPMAADLAAIPDGGAPFTTAFPTVLPSLSAAVPAAFLWRRPLGRQRTIGQQHRQEKRELLVR
jgi:hypothetical protein